MLIKILQIIIAVLLMLAVLLQNKGSSLSGIFGSGGGNVFLAKRGFDKFLVYATIIFAAIFLVLSIITIIKPF
ncbi:MAG: preprotein translocase subunit SecG [Patescibacteria group bacterium]|jgi:protein translocase SecG subunit